MLKYDLHQPMVAVGEVFQSEWRSEIECLSNLSINFTVTEALQKQMNTAINQNEGFFTTVLLFSVLLRAYASVQVASWQY